MSDINELEKYLLSKGFDVDIVKVRKQEDPILQSEELIKEAAELWEGKQTVIKKVLEAKINALGHYLLFKAIPVETTEVRRSITELLSLMEQFDKYVGERDRLQKERQGGAEEKPKTEEGETSSM